MLFFGFKSKCHLRLSTFIDLMRFCRVSKNAFDFRNPHCNWPAAIKIEAYVISDMHIAYTVREKTWIMNRREKTCSGAASAHNVV